MSNKFTEAKWLEVMKGRITKQLKQIAMAAAAAAMMSCADSPTGSQEPEPSSNSHKTEISSSSNDYNQPSSSSLNVNPSSSSIKASSSSLNVNPSSSSIKASSSSQAQQTVEQKINTYCNDSVARSCSSSLPRCVSDINWVIQGKTEEQALKFIDDMYKQMLNTECQQ